MKLVLFITLSLFTFQAWSQAPVKLDKLCVVVSGKAKDHNNFLDEELFKSGQSVAGVKCHVFGNWEDAVAYTKVHLKKEGKLLIVQGAHGTNEGTYLVNKGQPVSSSAVYAHLKDLQQNYHVGSVIHSCFSASIMNEKLIEDEKNDPRMDKLCLVSSSSFGRITRSHKDDIIQNLLKMKPGENLEKPFINNRGGVISSAAWSDVGLPQYLMSQKTEEGFATLEKMDEILRGKSICDSDAKANSAMCLAPNFTDETYQDVMSFMRPKVSDDRKGYFEGNVERSAKELRAKFTKDPRDLISKNGAICKEEFLKLYQTAFGEKLKNLEFYTEVMAMEEYIRMQPFYKANCVPYMNSLNEDDKKTLFSESFYTGVVEYQESLARLERKYTKKKFDENFDLYKFASDAIGEKKVCSIEERKKLIASKEGIVRSLFGMEFFTEEYSTNYDASDYSPDEMLWDSPVSTQTVMKGFQNSVLLKPLLKDEKDVKRRKACRDFKF